MGVPRGRLIGDATWTLDRDATWTLDGIATWTLDGSATWMLDWSATWNLDGDAACLPVAGSVVSSRIVLSRELVHGQLATFLPLVLTCACTPYDSMTSSRSHSLSLSPIGQGTGSFKYLPTGEEVGFGSNRCAPRPREDILAMRNPTCDIRTLLVLPPLPHRYLAFYRVGYKSARTQFNADVRAPSIVCNGVIDYLFVHFFQGTYNGGLLDCHHKWVLLDAEQCVTSLFPHLSQPLCTSLTRHYDSSL